MLVYDHFLQPFWIFQQIKIKFKFDIHHSDDQDEGGNILQVRDVLELCKSCCRHNKKTSISKQTSRKRATSERRETPCKGCCGRAGAHQWLCCSESTTTLHCQIPKQSQAKTNTLKTNKSQDIHTDTGQKKQIETHTKNYEVELLWSKILYCHGLSPIERMQRQTNTSA